MSTVASALDGAGQLLGEPCLADPGLAEDGEELGAPLPRGTLEGLTELHELALAADERRVEAALEGGAPGRRSSNRQAVSGFWCASWAARSIGSTVTASRTRRRVASPMQIPPVVTRLLEVDGDVDRVAGDEGSPAPRVAGQHLSGVDADAEGVSPASEAVAQLHGCPHRAQRVVLVGARDAEDSHDPIVAPSARRPRRALEHRRDQLE